MSRNRELMSALFETLAGVEQGPLPVEAMVAAAICLAEDPELALAWGQVLTEHTAPAAPSIEPWNGRPRHGFVPGRLPLTGRCVQVLWPDDSWIQVCDELADHPIHEVDQAVTG